MYNANDGILIQPLKAHKDTVYCVDYSKDGITIFINIVKLICFNCFNEMHVLSPLISAMV